MGKSFALRMAAVVVAAASAVAGGGVTAPVTATSTPTKLVASQGTPEGKFGISVAVDGDTMVVGSPDENGTAAGQGSAYVYTLVGGTWTEQARLTASDAAASNKFGFDVAVEGDTIVVGSPRNGGPRDGAGSAYMFDRVGDTWIERAKVSASDSSARDMFGFSVAISGDTAVVGAMWAGLHQGAAYVFERTGETWTEQAKLSPPDGAPGHEYGAAVAIAGDTAVVATGTQRVGVTVAQGSAYVFTRSGMAWTLRTELPVFDGSAAGPLGFSVDMTEDTLVVGAFFDVTGVPPQHGAVYVFTGGGGHWSRQAKLTASDGSAGDLFGRSVAIDGDTIAAGAHWDDAPGKLPPDDNQGSAYLFRRSGTTWTEQRHVTAPDATPGDAFGVSVALSGDTFLVGAGFADVDGQPARGAAYIFAAAA